VALEAGSMDAIADFATPIPLTMIAELLGVPTADQPRLVEWSHASVRVFDEACTPEEGDRAEQAMIDFQAYVGDLLQRHRRYPVENLTSALLAAEVDGDRLTEEELVATCILTLNAGHEATVQAIGNALLALGRHPESYAALRSDAGLVGTAVDELLRFDTPLQMFERWVLEDLEWNGVPFGGGPRWVSCSGRPTTTRRDSTGPRNWCWIGPTTPTSPSVGASTSVWAPPSPRWRWRSASGCSLAGFARSASSPGNARAGSQPRVPRSPGAPARTRCLTVAAVVSVNRLRWSRWCRR
jgi:hypothetical protein